MPIHPGASIAASSAMIHLCIGLLRDRKEKRSDIADHLAPPSFGFFGVTPHRVRLGENADGMVVAGFDHGKRFGLCRVKCGDGLMDIHRRVQHVLPAMKDATKTLLGVVVRSVSIRDQYEPLVMASTIYGNNLSLRTRGKFATEFRNRHVYVHGH